MEGAKQRAFASVLLVAALVLVAHGWGSGERGGAAVELDGDGGQKAQPKSESVGHQLLKAQVPFPGDRKSGRARLMGEGMKGNVQVLTFFCQFSDLGIGSWFVAAACKSLQTTRGSNLTRIALSPTPHAEAHRNLVIFTEDAAKILADSRTLWTTHFLQEMFDGEGAPPSIRSDLPASVRDIGDETRGPTAPAGGLGLKGMSQKSFERRVTKEVIAHPKRCVDATRLQANEATSFGSGCSEEFLAQTIKSRALGGRGLSGTPQVANQTSPPLPLASVSYLH